MNVFHHPGKTGLILLVAVLGGFALYSGSDFLQSTPAFAPTKKETHRQSAPASRDTRRLFGSSTSSQAATERRGPVVSRNATGPQLKLCRIVVPDSHVVKACVDKLVAALHERGATVRVISPRECLDQTGLKWRADLQGGRERVTTILVGNIVANRALLPIYAAFLDFSDAFYPGGEGYEIRTILDAPIRGGDCIVLGASSERGMLRAVRRFVDIVKALEKPLPSILEVELAPDVLAKVKNSYDSNHVYQGFLYGLTGDRKYAEAARSVFLSPQTSGYEGYFEHDDYSWESLVRSWVMLRDSGIFTDDEIETVHQNLMGALVHIENHPSVRHDGTSLGSRHTTMGTSGFLTIVRYLLRRGEFQGENLARLHRYRQWGESYFAVATATFHDDVDDVTSFHSVQPVANYALETGLAGYFKRRAELSPLELAIQRAYACTDNLGYYCGTGVYEETRPGSIGSGVMLGYPLAMAVCINRDAGAAWLLKHFRGTEISNWGVLGVAGTHAFACGDSIPQREPRELLGVLRLPLGSHRYSRTRRAPDPHDPGAMYLPISYEKTFDKLCFRDEFGPEGQYLVLEGNQAPLEASLMPFDGNSIIRYTDRGVVWLVANTDRRGNYYRNAISVDGGNMEMEMPGVSGSELVGQANVGSVYLAVSRLRDYHSTDWTRHILWLRGRAFGVVDAVNSKKTGVRTIFCNYKSAPPAELSDRTWISRSGAAEFRLLNVDDMPLGSVRDGDEEGATRPTYLRQVRTVKAEGYSMFRNLFYVSTPDRPQRFEARAFGENGLLIRGDSVPALLVVRNTESGPVKCGLFETDAESLFVGAEGVCAVGGAKVKYDGKIVAVGRPAPVEVVNALNRMWGWTSSSSLAAKERTGVEPKPVWTYDSMLPQRPAVLSPLVSSSESPRSGAVDEVGDGCLSYNYGNVTWANSKGMTLTFDLRRSLDISSVEYATGRIASPEAYPILAHLKDRAATVEFSDDNFVADVRGGPVSFRAGFTFEMLHKGMRSPMGRWRLDDVKQKARYVRIGFPQGPVEVREVYIRQATGTEARFGPSLVTNWEGKGRKDCIITTDTGELVVLDSSGKKRWGHVFAGAVTCLKAVALEAGHPGVLVVGTRESRLYCFSKDGEQRWMIDCGTPAPEWKITALATFNECGIPFSIDVSARNAEGRSTIIVGQYCRATLVSPDGKVVDHFKAGGDAQTMSLVNGMDFTGDGVADALFGNSWGLVPIVDLARHTAERLLTVPNGTTLALQGWENSNPKNPSVLFASENGIGVFYPLTEHFVWKRNSTLLSCVTLVNPEGKGPIVVGKKDGCLLVLDANGEVTRKAMLGSEIRSIVVTSASPLRVWVATGVELLSMNENLEVLKRVACVARHLEQIDDERLLLLKQDGSVCAISTQ
jgi:outer membrane protein assembly factor BamB